MSQRIHEFTLFATDPKEARMLQREVETAGYEVHVVFGSGDQHTPYLQSAFTKIIGPGNIRRFLAT